ncbi:MAG: hypothetical protein AB7H77_06840 [Bdellovibrionales bacterium]
MGDLGFVGSVNEIDKGQKASLLIGDVVVTRLPGDNELADDLCAGIVKENIDPYKLYIRGLYDKLRIVFGERGKPSAVNFTHDGSTQLVLNPQPPSPKTPRDRHLARELVTLWRQIAGPRF